MAKYIRVVAFVMAALVAATAVADVTDSSTEVVQISKEDERQLKCLADNVYYEAGSESTEGKLAVAQIVVNRTNHPNFPGDPCRVVYQKTRLSDRIVCQFSWSCNKSVRTQRVNQERWDESYDAAKRVLLEGFRLPKLQGALYFHAIHVNPGWGLPRAAKIGNHIFYRERSGRAI